MWRSCKLMVCFTFFLLASCATPRPDNVNDVCQIFKQYPKWYWAAQDVSVRWKVPIDIQMAIIHQESRFHAIAKPPRTKLLWVIPWKRPSSSYGYTQALDQTWHEYKDATGNYFASRDRFNSAVDFIGWYAYEAHKRAHISRRDPYRLYLAYHEGIGGYIKGTYRNKYWLQSVARKVQRQASRYRNQLAVCEKSLREKPWWRVW